MSSFKVDIDELDQERSILTPLSAWKSWGSAGLFGILSLQMAQKTAARYPEIIYNSSTLKYNSYYILTKWLADDSIACLSLSRFLHLAPSVLFYFSLAEPGSRLCVCGFSKAALIPSPSRPRSLSLFICLSFPEAKAHPNNSGACCDFTQPLVCFPIKQRWNRSLEGYLDRYNSKRWKKKKRKVGRR